MLTGQCVAICAGGARITFMCMRSRAMACCIAACVAGWVRVLYPRVSRFLIGSLFCAPPNALCTDAHRQH